MKHFHFCAHPNPGFFPSWDFLAPEEGPLLTLKMTSEGREKFLPVEDAEKELGASRFVVKVLRRSTHAVKHDRAKVYWDECRTHDRMSAWNRQIRSSIVAIDSSNGFPRVGQNVAQSIWSPSDLLLMTVERLVCCASARVVPPSLLHRIDEIAVRNCVPTHNAHIVAIVVFFLLEEAAWRLNPQTMQGLSEAAAATIDAFKRHAVEMKMWRAFAKIWHEHRSSSISNRYPCGVPAAVFGYRLQHRGKEFTPFHDESLRSPHPFGLPPCPVVEIGQSCRVSLREALQRAPGREFLDAPLRILKAQFLSLAVHEKNFSSHFFPPANPVELFNAMCFFGSELFTATHKNYVQFPNDSRRPGAPPGDMAAAIVETLRENFPEAAAKSRRAVQYQVQRISEGGEVLLGLYAINDDSTLLRMVHPKECVTFVQPPLTSAALGGTIDPSDLTSVLRMVTAIVEKQRKSRAMAIPSNAESGVLYQVLESHPHAAYIAGCGRSNLAIRCADSMIVVQRTCGSVTDWSVRDCFSKPAETSRGSTDAPAPSTLLTPAAVVTLMIPRPSDIPFIHKMLRPSELRQMLMYYWSVLVEQNKGNVLLNPADIKHRMYLYPENSKTLMYVLRHHRNYYEIRGCGITDVFVCGMRNAVRGLMEPSFFVQRTCDTICSFSVKDCFERDESLLLAKGYAARQAAPAKRSR
jgi:hypothetical protein